MHTSSQTTLKFLHIISDRLSSRPVCRGVEYRIMIVDNGAQIGMVPYLHTFKNRYSRKESDKLNIVNYARDILIEGGYDVFNMLDGIYIYQQSVSGKQRRWVRYDIQDMMPEGIEIVEEAK